MGFTTFGLSDHIMKGIGAAGYTVPTPIQILAIEPALAGRDIIACAQTGTGKTAAFVLPILHHLASGAGVHAGGKLPRALVLTPTRELCQQVQLAAAKYGKFLALRSTSIYGGAGMEQQIKALRRGADIVVATPGRLLDHMQRKTVDLSGIRILVLDEADRMLDMGFINDVRKIIAAIPSQRQTMLFSATISADIKTLASNILRDPQTVQVGERRNPAETIVQHFYNAPQGAKIDLLVHAMEAEQMQSVLVFSRTKHGADKISRRLERTGIASAAIHSNRTQSQREKALEGFKEGKFRVLVATDIAARGIDVSGISHVINYDVPQYPEDYIHRIGRTGRAGASGDAITFVSREEQQYLTRIEKFVGKRYTVNAYPGFTASPQQAQAHVSFPSRSGRTAPQHDNTRHPQSGRTAPQHENKRHPQSGRTAPKHDNTRHPQSGRTVPHTDKRYPVQPGRKKPDHKKMESYSSDSSGAGWSNY
jgi:ATP-dependent RNA helicase RhlE